MNFVNNEKGYTLIELIIVICILGAGSLLGVGIYTLYHFISKAW